MAVIDAGSSPSAAIPGPADRRAGLERLARVLAMGAIAGAVCGLLIGGVLGRLAMRLLAATSPWYAQGGITDDQATVGEITADGTLGLALFCVIAGGLGGLIYVWVRRVLPASRSGRILGYGLFAGTVGGALFVHDYPSFDYTILGPAWLAVSLFVALPALFGLSVAALVEAVDRPGGLGRRLPWWVLVLGGLVVGWPLLLVATFFIGAAIAVVWVPELRLAWRSRWVTLAGQALFVLLVLWGGYGIVADIVSLIAERPSTLPLNP